MSADSDRKTARRLRRCMLTHLYTWFREVPLAAVELRHLAETCRVDATEMNWNIVYLEKKGWVSLSHDINCPPFVSCAVELTAAGIDLVEDADLFDAQFPADSDIG
jgi:hypothetical protein